jgi:CcmD family protein
MQDSVAHAAQATTSTFNDGSMIVVYVLGIIMLGLFAYMFMIDRKLSKVEKEVKDKG